MCDDLSRRLRQLLAPTEFVLNEGTAAPPESLTEFVVGASPKRYFDTPSDRSLVHYVELSHEREAVSEPTVPSSGRQVVAKPYVCAARDASWSPRPDTRSVKVMHIATVAGTAACNPRSTPLDSSGYRDPEGVYDDVRCRRSGCHAHWDKIPGRPRQPLGEAT